jgi:CHAD domain-containing protein
MRVMVSLECPARKQLKRLREALGEVSATGNAKAIHNARVACRRLNELLDLMNVWLDADRIRRPRRSFKRIRTTFERVRDVDVLLASLFQPQAGEHLQPHELARLEGELTRRREKELKRALRDCRKLRPEKAIRQTEQLCGVLEKAAVDERPALKSRLDQMFSERADALLACDPRHVETSDLHQDRIRLKRLRYVAELIRRFELGLSNELIDAFTHMQDLLGRWHDHVVAADQIARLARRREVMQHQTAWSARLLEYAAWRLRSAEQDREQVVAEWAGLERALQEARAPAGPQALAPERKNPEDLQPAQAL